MERMFQLAQETAKMAGRLIMEHFGPQQRVDHKGEIDLVTESKVKEKLAELDRRRSTSRQN